MKHLFVALLLTITGCAQADTLVPAKSEVAFSFKQMGVSVDGRFARFTADVALDTAALDKSRAVIEVETASLTTGEVMTDTEAKKPVWLDTLGFPKARFESTQVKALGGNRYEAAGNFILKGKARPMTVPFTLSTNADGTRTVSASITLKRSDFGIGGGEWNDPELVADEVPVRVRLVLAK